MPTGSDPDKGVKLLHEMLEGLKPGYHIRPIPKGTLGEPSKILEEAAEFEDALEQGVTLMALVELADLYGAMRAYLTKHGLTMADLEKMADVTERAFRNGRRS